ncbi:MAG TPA: hypothetical protein VN039_07835 [Nitrospira sp.]|nr:hypothetical protein [Nitrospira sp.]
MAYTREGKAQRLIARFHDAIVEKEIAQAKYDHMPTTVHHEAKSKAIARFNMLRGTLYRIVVSSSEEL